MSTKMVVCMRRDLKMRRGKEIAQGGHSVMAFITRNLHPEPDLTRKVMDGKEYFSIGLSQDEVAWMENSYKKVTCQVKSEAELLEVVEKAKAAGLTVHMVTDSGKTEFGGVATNTCCALGPHSDEKFEGVTSDLELY
jgi:PTH2 family peptidyl-tRNA hydrolase